MNSNKRMRTILNVIKVDIDTYMLRPKWLFIIILFFFVNYFSTKEAIIKLGHSGYNYNMWDILFNTLINQYFVLYLFVPTAIALTLPIILSSLNNPVMLKVGNREDWLISKIVGIILNTALFIFIGILITIFYASLFTNFDANWSISAKTMQEPYILVSKEIVSSFKYPLAAFFCSISLLLLGLSTFSIIMLITYIHFQKGIVPIIVVLFLLMLSFIGMRVFIGFPKIAYAFFSTNILLTHTMQISTNGYLISLTFWIIFDILMFIVGKKKIENCDLLYGGSK
jgi:hypothetical protein